MSLSHQVWLVRHGETEWSRDHKHTSTTDLPLTEVGERVARELSAKLTATPFAQVLVSPRQRALETARLAGYDHIEIDDDLVEWNYGDYEGRTTAQIRRTVPGWAVWSHPIPHGETSEQVGTRLDRVLERTRAVDGPTLLIGHGHSLRALAARWLGLPATDGRLFRLDTATVSVLGHERETPVLLRWNS